MVVPRWVEQAKNSSIEKTSRDYLFACRRTNAKIRLRDYTAPPSAEILDYHHLIAQLVQRGGQMRTDKSCFSGNEDALSLKHQTVLPPPIGYSRHLY
jgi:hypothetical protein